MKTIDNFEEEYICIRNHIVECSSFNNTLFETYGEELQYVLRANPNTVWTLIEGDSQCYIQAGLHIVNRLGYFITTEPYKSEKEQYVI